MSLGAGGPGGGLATENAPSLSLPLKYILASLASFALLVGLLWLQSESLTAYFRNPPVLGLTHLATLGWVTMIIMGAAYQLVPVVLQARIHSETIGHLGFYLLAVGTAGMVYGLFRYQIPLVELFGFLVLLSGYLFCYNLYKTVGALEDWDATAWWITAAVTYFGLTITWGWLAAHNLKYQYLDFLGQRIIGFHALLGFAGWFTSMIMGVGYKLIPMFALSHTEGEGRSRTVFYLLNAGIILGSIGQLSGLPPSVTAIGLVVAAAAAGLFLRDIRHTFETRRRKRLDLTMKYVVASVTSLALLALGGAAVWAAPGPVEPRVILAIGLFGVMGWVSLMIMGMLYKVVPFLVWYNRYSSKVGLEPVPLLKDMFHEAWGHRFFWLYLAGLLVSTAGTAAGAPTLTSAGLAALTLAGWGFVTTVLDVFRK